MTTTDFITEVTVDTRRRISIGKLHVRPNERFFASRTSDGGILLTPASSIPTEELKIWENIEVRDSILRGLWQASTGEMISEEEVFPEGLDDED